MRNVGTKWTLSGAAAIGCALLLALGACSDSDDPEKDAGPAPADQAVTPDPDKGVTPDPDKGGGSDQGGGGDGGEEFHLSCQSRQFCEGCCPDQDQACKDACLASLTQESQQAWADLQSCGSTNCKACSNDVECTECIEANCKPERDACDFGAAGTASCEQTLSCTDGCPELKVDRAGTAETCPVDPGIVCFQQCMTAATPAASDAAYTVAVCVYMKCGDECIVSSDQAKCDSCMTSNCSDEQKACAAL